MRRRQQVVTLVNRQAPVPEVSDSGFSLAEFLISTLMLLIISSAVFSLIGGSQKTASYQTEVQAVMDNTRIAMDTVERYLRQAGNDPAGTGLVGIAITSASEVRILADLTGSAGGGNPDKGDPDGDTGDSGEDVTIRYNSAARSIEVVPGAGSAQPITNYISGFSMQYFDAAGTATMVGADVRRIQLTISGESIVPDPQTGQRFGMTLRSDVQIKNRM
jgi:Tfp pilus assembly protein PilW